MGRSGSGWQQGVSGWLTNTARRDRRDSADTLTDAQVKELIGKVDLVERYSRLAPAEDRLLRVRDKALLALPWIWPKRGSEYLALKLSEVLVTDSELLVTYRLKKKAKRHRACAGCGSKNALASTYCKSCGLHMAEGARVETTGQKDRVVTKRKRADYYFCEFVARWVAEMKGSLRAPPTSLLFPPFRTRSNRFDLLSPKPMSVANFNAILQRLDPSLTSHMFRYGHAEVLFRMGYSAWEVKKAGDWSSDKMPQIYADRKGLTAEDRKFAEDTRML